MRVLIMTDMEGVSGIVHWDQVSGGSDRFEEGRVLYTEEVNAAVRGARAAGASEIVVVDCHGAGKSWTFNSLVPDLLETDCDWVCGHEWGRYSDLWEEGCDACLLVGMHARSLTPDGGLCHTISSVKYRNLWFNDDRVGETGVNAALNGHYGVPVALVTGDTAVCREARELLGDALPTVAVKKSLARFSARNIAPSRARRMIEQGAKVALENPDRVPPYVPARPTTIRIEVNSPEKLADLRGRAGVEITGDTTAESRGPDWLTAWNQFWPFA